MSSENIEKRLMVFAYINVLILVALLLIAAHWSLSHPNSSVAVTVVLLVSGVAISGLKMIYKYYFGKR